MRVSPRLLMNKLVDIRSVTTLKDRVIPSYNQLPYSNLHNLHWPSDKPLQNIYVVKKPWVPDVRDAMMKFITFIHQRHPNCNIIVSPDVADEIAEETKESKQPCVIYSGKNSEIVQKTDLLVSLGGDGTILRGVSTFSNTVVPPVLSFSLGTLGFLLPFNFQSFENAFEEVYQSQAKLLHRSRLECHFTKKNNTKALDGDINDSRIKIHAMNDIVLHRGSMPTLTTLEICIDDQLFTRTTADGIILATPTGSTAYSLSAGGAIVNPAVPCILMTPICPRSLSFRPLVLPATSKIKVKVIGKEQSRTSNAKLTVDGVPQDYLNPGDEIYVNTETASPDKDTGIWCVVKSDHDWTSGINELLGFNSGFKGTNK
ncbi:unnamed protein product [Kuraishia capsulata CBS 1993]|uniref:Uncharacterized protein n=1 Tax=Kuraishia capsulata CBS 1993 TaxID=1382522 RepID=W6MIK1_9ASCO|nr:uncharacterized protein KUCA_T00000147001 [Kuraishia capsulata CBS 1993]CDK24187.1 unnamed protein product [Kuraishia capsulata CBS 1993]